MQNLKVTNVYGAKWNLGNEEIYISTRSFFQTNSYITLSTQSKKTLKKLTFTIAKIPKYDVNIDISILTNDNQIIPIGTLTNKNPSLCVSLTNANNSIAKIKFVIRNSNKEQKNIVLKSVAA